MVFFCPVFAGFELSFAFNFAGEFPHQFRAPSKAVTDLIAICGPNSSGFVRAAPQGYCAGGDWNNPSNSAMTGVKSGWAAMV